MGEIKAVVLIPVILISVMVSVGLPTLAHAAGGNYRTSEAIWHRSDKCNRDAIAKFPDHTREAQAAREAYFHACNGGSGLPSREPLPVEPRGGNPEAGALPNRSAPQ
jgi:hypothetical protein